MNPFNWPGPGFLLFYLGVVIATLLGLRAWRRRREGGPPPELDLGDPYLVAYLRGQHEEAVRVALAALLARGLVAADGARLSRVGDVTPVHPLERAALAALWRPGKLRDVQGDGGVLLATAPLRERLERAGLLPDRAVHRRRAVAGALAIGGLFLLGGFKIAVGIARERPIGLLLVSCAGMAWAVIATLWGKRTVLGDRTLAETRTLLQGLRSDGHRDPATLALAAAVFGIGVLPQVAFAHHAALGARAGVEAGGSGCGTSCSSSCSSGGGDGGGGCGGCGGCGGGD